MKRNLILGIAFIGAVALSSCSSTTQLTRSSNPANDDDVYYTKAKAGDRTEYINDPDYLASQQANDDDDYYYYGDYASRINRFNYYSPFDYGDPFYYGYSPYAYTGRLGIGLGLGLGYGYGYGNPYGMYYGYSPYFNWGYSPYFDLGYGYSPYLGYGYGLAGGSYFGGYGSLALGGTSYGQRSRPQYANGQNPVVNRTIRSNMPTPNSAILRGNTAQGRVTNGVMQRNVDGSGARAVRSAQPQQQQPIFQRAPQQSFGNSNNSGSFSGGNSGGGGSSGGGGRPARP